MGCDGDCGGSAAHAVPPQGQAVGPFLEELQKRGVRVCVCYRKILGNGNGLLPPNTTFLSGTGSLCLLFVAQRLPPYLRDEETEP